MLKKMSLFLLLGLMLARLTSNALATGPFGDRPRSPEKMLERIAQELGLTQEQKEKYLSGAKKVEADAQSLKAKNKELFAAIEKEMVKDNPDGKAIHNYMRQIGQNRTEIQFKRMEQLLQLRKELSPEQKAKFEKMKGRGRAGKTI